MAQASNKIRHGDIFAVPLPDKTFIFGRVVLDIYGMTKRRMFPPDSPLPGLGKALLIEMFRHVSADRTFQPSDVLIPGVFVESDEVGHGWPIVDHLPITVENVYFPESLIGFMHDHGEAAFERGEIRIPIPISLDRQMKIGVYRVRNSAYTWPNFCLNELGRSGEIPKEYRNCSHLRDCDLRYVPEVRREIYRYLPLDPDASYFEQQASLGLDLGRFYR